MLVTLFTSELDHFSNFRFCSSTWPQYDGLVSIKTEMMKRPTILNGEKLGFLIYASKKLFCSSDERKMECPPEETTIDFTNYNRIFLRSFMQFKKENENDDLEELKHVEQQSSERKKSCFDEV